MMIILIIPGEIKGTKVHLQAREEGSGNNPTSIMLPIQVFINNKFSRSRLDFRENK